MAVIERFMEWLGFGLCHQLPERSYAYGGLQAPVCARDTGIYFGFLVGFLLVQWIHRGERPREFPPPLAWGAMAFFLLFMAWDGVTSYAALRSTTNDMRLITGLGVGFSAAALITPMLNDELWRRSSPERVLDPGWRLLAWLMAIPATFLVLRFAGPYLGVVYSVLVAGGILFTLSAINLVIVCMLPMFDRKADSLVGAVSPAAVALALALLEVAVASQLRVILLGTVSRIG